MREVAIIPRMADDISKGAPVPLPWEINDKFKRVFY
jgi:hypothetical protein